MQGGLVQERFAGFRAAFAQNEREVWAVKFSDARGYIGYVENGGMRGNGLLKSVPYIRIA